MANLSLVEYLTLCTDFRNEPTAENSEKIQDFLNKIELRERIPIKDKIMNMVTLISSLPYDYDAPGSAGYIEMGSVVYGLLPYALNLENDAGALATSFGSYDLMDEFGLIDLIMERCEKDYKKFVRLLNNTVNFSNIYRITESMELFDSKEFEKWLDNMTKFKEQLTPEVLSDLKFIASQGGTDYLAKIKSDLEEIAVQQAQSAVKSHEDLAAAVAKEKAEKDSSVEEEVKEKA